MQATFQTSLSPHAYIGIARETVSSKASASISNQSRTTASSHQSCGRRSSPRQSRDGGSNAGFSYLSASSRSERRLRDSLPRRVSAGMSRSSGSCVSGVSGASTERSYREGSRNSLASSASERYLSECRSPRQQRLESPRSSHSGTHSTYSSIRNRSPSPQHWAGHRISSIRNRSPSPRIGQMWDFFGGSEPSNL